MKDGRKQEGKRSRNWTNIKERSDLDKIILVIHCTVHANEIKAIVMTRMMFRTINTFNVYLHFCFLVFLA